MVHFAADEFCNTSKYPIWYGEFELASQAWCQELQGITGFMSFMLPGIHEDGRKLWYNWNFAKVSPELGDCFETMWFHLDRNQI